MESEVTQLQPTVRGWLWHSYYYGLKRLSLTSMEPLFAIEKQLLDSFIKCHANLDFAPGNSLDFLSKSKHE